MFNLVDRKAQDCFNGCGELGFVDVVEFGAGRVKSLYPGFELVLEFAVNVMLSFTMLRVAAQFP
jgi:hypothetical protein